MDLRHEHCGGCGELVHWDGDGGPATVNRRPGDEPGTERWTYAQAGTELHTCEQPA
jgi:hypothetical protein